MKKLCASILVVMMLACASSTTVFASSGGNQIEEKPVVTGSASITPFAMMELQRTVQRSYRRSTDAPIYIHHVEYVAGVRFSGNLYLVSCDKINSTTYLATYSGTIFGQS